VKLKVISLNLWHGSDLLPAIIDFLRNENADILLLQEVYDAGEAEVPDIFNSLQVLRRGLYYEHIEFAEAFRYDGPYGPLPHGNAIFSKLPITKTDRIFLQEPTLEVYRDTSEHWPILPSVLQHVEITADIGAVNVYNLHGIWDLDGDNYSPQRQEMSRIILEATKDK
jgi:endonuclease/exonuclease/phosphatase family metal-dependent hydrolase